MAQLIQDRDLLVEEVKQMQTNINSIKEEITNKHENTHTKPTINSSKSEENTDNYESLKVLQFSILLNI